MKRRVEAGDLRQARQRRGGRVDPLQRGARVQRRERREGGDRGAHAIVDARRAGKARAAVHDAVTDRLGLAAAAAARAGQRTAQRRGMAAGIGVRIPALLAALQDRVAGGVDERVLEAARAGVDDEDAQPGATTQAAACGQVQSRTSGMSSKCSRM